MLQTTQWEYLSTDFMATILDKIVAQTAEDLIKRKKEIGFNDLHSLEGFEKKRIDFKSALQKKDEVSIIAEVKKGSPSKGVIREAISVLTDKPFFMGDLDYLNAISKRVQIPLLRKDFIIDPFQIKEARAYGADAVLIIVAITDGSQLNELLAAAKEFELSALVECYDQADFNR